MTFLQLLSRPPVRAAVLAAGAFALAACAGDVDNTTGSRLEQQPAGVKPEPPIEAGDIAIAGQDFSHSIRQLPEVADAARPPLVRFTGVTSIVAGPIDTEPYTALLRDRLLLGAREKLRFVERQLPPLTAHKKIHSNREVTPPVTISSDSPDYQVLAELRGKPDADTLRIQMEFVDFHTGQVLFNAVYRIRRESSGDSGTNGGQIVSGEDAMPASPAAQDDMGGNPPPGRAPDGMGAQPIPRR